MRGFPLMSCKSHAKPGISVFFAGALALCLILPAGCSTKNMFDTGLPGWTTQVKVTEVRKRDRYLEVNFRGDGFDIARFFPASETCSAMFKMGSESTYASAGAYGEFKQGEQTCLATGVSDLEQWRRRFGKGSSLTGGAPIPRAQATYELVAEDKETLLLRGRFPLAGKLRASGTGDLVLALPRTPECEEVAQRKRSSMEYRPSGNPALALLAKNGRCAVRGFVSPVEMQ